MRWQKTIPSLKIYIAKLGDGWSFVSETLFLDVDDAERVKLVVEATRQLEVQKEKLLIFSFANYY